jgi:hypothetical protein
MNWHLKRFFEVLNKEGVREAVSKAVKYSKLDILKMNNELRYELPDKLYRPFFERKYGSGIEVAEKDWDNLIILDAYRYDYFEKYSQFDGELSRVLTQGNWSLEWVLRNFEDRDLSDTVCVSGNIFYERLDQDTLFTLKSLGRDPEVITETAREMNEKYPNKRLIVHYMTPHIPHRGKIARELASEGEEFADIFDLYKKDKIGEEKVEKSYVENIEIVESYVESLLEELDGKTVITSDHGKNLGEKQFGLQRFDHGHETEECRFVPWLELPYDEQKTIKSEEPLGFDYSDQGVMNERLEALGYL